jgi:nicotinamidase/pyrazinamidase
VPRRLSANVDRTRATDAPDRHQDAGALVAITAGSSVGNGWRPRCSRSRLVSRCALLVVDVQRDFCPGGALPSPGGDRIIPALNRHIGQALKSGMPVYASRDWHPEITTHFKAYGGGEWPPHCVQGTAGAEFHPQLELPSNVIVISKGEVAERPGYSAFEGRTPDGRTLADDLRARAIDTLYVAGIATDYCVKQTVLDALREGFGVTVLTDAVSGIDVRPGDAERAVADMRAAGARVSDSVVHGARRALRVVASALAVLGTIIAAFSIVRSSDRFRRRNTPPGVRRDPGLIGATRFPRKGDTA